MSRSVAWFVLIRDGKKRYYFDEWAGTFLYRELLWGPEELENWLTAGEEVDYEPEDLHGGVVANFDTNRLTCHFAEGIELPRVQAVLQRLLEQAWPGFEVCTAVRGDLDLYAAAGVAIGSDEEEDDLDEAHYDRPETVREAAGLYDEDEEDHDEDNEYDDEIDDEDDEDEIRTWVTLVDETGNVRHRQIGLLSIDLINGDESAIEQLVALKAAEVPPEKVVSEGMWIRLTEREIGIWGGIPATRNFPRIQKAWPGWSVRWADNGYADQCETSGVPGVPMSDAEAMAKITPAILSNKRFTFGAMLGVVGGELKSTAIKAAGCLVFALSVPILIFGLVAGNLQSAGIAVGSLIVVAAIIFKVIEHRIRRKLRDSPLSDVDNDESAERPPVVGPMDDEQRRQQFDQLLSACTLPPISEQEPHFIENPLL